MHFRVKTLPHFWVTLRELGVCAGCFAPIRLFVGLRLDVLATSLVFLKRIWRLLVMRSHSPRVYRGACARRSHLCPAFALARLSSSSVAVSITPDIATVVSSQTLQLTALIKNTPNVAVQWSATAGTITSSGLYHAPKVTTDTVVTVTATSVANPGKFDRLSVVVTAPKPAPKPQAACGRLVGSGQRDHQGVLLWSWVQWLSRLASNRRPEASCDSRRHSPLGR